MFKNGNCIVTNKEIKLIFEEGHLTKENDIFLLEVKRQLPYPAYSLYRQLYNRKTERFTSETNNYTCFSCSLFQLQFASTFLAFNFTPFFPKISIVLRRAASSINFH